jgi:DNA-binding response OmpR family regulator
MPWRIQLLFRRYQTVNLLLIENYDPMARALRAGLEEEEFLVHTADDMIGVHRLAASEDFDIILLDLPPLAQLTALLDLRQAKIFTPVLLLTVPETPAGRANDWGLGPCDTLVKPFRFEVLLGRLRCLARREPAMPV